MRNKVIGCTLCFFLLTGLIGCSNEKRTPQKTLLEPVSLSIDSVKASYRDMELKKIITGQIVPETVDLCFEVNGNFGQYYVQIGDKVSKGEILATLDISGLEDKLIRLVEEQEKVNLSYESQEAELNVLCKEYEATLEQMKIREIEKNPEEIKKQMEIVKEQLSLSQQLKELELGEMKRNIKETKEAMLSMDLLAPCDGVVVSVLNLEKSNSVGTDTIILTLAIDDTPYLSTEFISTNKIKSCADYYAIVGGSEYDVEYLAPKQNTSSTSFITKIETTNFEFVSKEASLAIGDYAILVLVEKRLEKVLTVPAEAIYEDISGEYVYIMNGDSRIRQAIETGLRDNYGVEVKTGLNEGDEVYVKN